MANTDLLSDYLTVEELSQELGKSTRTLEHWRRLGTGPRRTKIGKTILYAREDVQEWLRAQREPGRASG